MNVRWSKTALIELEEIFIYISAHDRTAAKTVVDRIEIMTNRLGQFPMMGPSANETQVRTLPVVRYPFVIFYAIDQESDEVASCTFDIRRNSYRRLISFDSSVPPTLPR